MRLDEIYGRGGGSALSCTCYVSANSDTENETDDTTDHRRFWEGLDMPRVSAIRDTERERDKVLYLKNS